MVGKQLSHFRILEKIGEGGMGIVYKAVDEKLGRNVALKVLQQDAVGDESRRLRFMREARAAAAVTHPHIAAIHEIDEADGQIFIAMELVEGKTLDEHLAGRPPRMRDGLRIAIEISEALARAHKAGVVHRDLKPQNIIVGSDGHAKVLDFGLAKLLDDEPADAPHGTDMQTVSAEMTREGKVLGTAAYMSPEQARALPVDARSDIFSFGVLLYEMFAGRSPFMGRTVTDTLSAILRDPQPPASQQNPEIPPELERAIDKCLEKEAKDRYQHADDLVVDLRRMRRETESQPVSRVSGPVAAAGGKRSWTRPAILVGAIALAIVAAFLVKGMLGEGGLIPAARADVTGLAVMPFHNLQDVEDSQRLGQIMQELIITDLSELETLTVYSGQRLQDIRKQLGDDARTVDSDTATQVARRAGADRMLMGTLSKLGERWILTSQLVGVADGAVVKSERIDGDDLYSMVDDLSARLRANMGLASSSATQSIKDKTTDSVEAYEEYLAGVEALNESGFASAVQHFEKAIEIDPRFGQAYYKLAIALWWEGGTRAVGLKDGAAMLERALAADIKLPESDRRRIEAFLPLLNWDYQGSVPDLKRLVEDFPDDKEAWYGLGEALWHSPDGGADLAAIEAFEKALELDPSFHLAYGHVDETYQHLRLYDRAIDGVRALIEQSPDDPFWYRMWIGWLARKGDAIVVESAIDQAFDRISDPAERREMLIVAGQSWGGEDQEGQRVTFYRRALEVPLEEGRHGPLALLGWHHYHLGEPQEAEPLFIEALDASPNSYGANQGLIELLMSEGRYDEALLRTRALAARSPEHSHPYSWWIAAAVGKGDDAEVARAIDRALGDEPDDTRKVWVWGQVAEDYLEIGDTNTAARYGELVSAIDPDANPLLFGSIALARRDYDSAGKHFEKYVGIDSVALDRLRDLALAQRKFDDAIRVSERIRTLQPQSWWVFGSLVTDYILAGRFDEAEQLLERDLESLTERKDRQYVIRSLARVWLQVGEVARAEQYLEHGTLENPLPRDLAWEAGTRSWIASYTGRYDEALRHHERALEILPESVDRWGAALRFHAGDLAGSEQALRRWLADGPVERDTYEALAGVLAEQGRFGEALPVAEKCLAMEENRQTLGIVAWVLVAGDLDLERGIELAEAGRAIPQTAWEPGMYSPSWPSPEHALGLAHLKQGHFDQAATILEEAARLRPRRTSIKDHLKLAKRGQTP
jgi:tetratricopeptide (TPR) repeat protein/tRNA A-37 threonylcarbamoyl transferase component Bud32